jgi:hypothetical protein
MENKFISPAVWRKYHNILDDDPRRTITRGVDVETMKGARMQFSSFEENVAYCHALDTEEEHPSKPED